MCKPAYREVEPIFQTTLATACQQCVSDFEIVSDYAYVGKVPSLNRGAPIPCHWMDQRAATGDYIRRPGVAPFSLYAPFSGNASRFSWTTVDASSTIMLPRS